MRRLLLVIVSGLLVAALTGCSTIAALVKSVVHTTEPLRFHQVLEMSQGSCTGDLQFNDPSVDSQCLRVGPSRLELNELKAVEVSQSNGEWTVLLVVPDDAVGPLADLTGELATQSDPRNRLALVLGDDLITAPAVADRIEGGTLQLAGNFTQAEAQELVKRLGG